MGMNTWKTLTALLALLLLLTGTALAEETPLEDFTYTILEDRVVLQKYKGTAKEVSVAGSYGIDGISYPVTLDTATVFNGNTKITSVAPGEGDPLCHHGGRRFA